MEAIEVMGGLAGVFALALLVLPAVRVAQGRLDARDAAGLWVSGAGFALLAAAALALEGAAAHGAVVSGVVLAVIGNVAQRRRARRGR